MSVQTVYAALVRALRDAKTETAQTAQRKAHDRIKANKTKLMKLCGGATPLYFETWQRARLAAGFLADDAEQGESSNGE